MEEIEYLRNYASAFLFYPTFETSKLKCIHGSPDVSGTSHGYRLDHGLGGDRESVAAPRGFLGGNLGKNLCHAGHCYWVEAGITQR